MAAEQRYSRDHFRKGDRCEVKLRAGKDGFVWKGGRVKEFTGQGAYVKLDEGNSNFFWFADMRPEATPPKAPEPPKMPKPDRPLATIGDAVAARTTAPPTPPALAVVPAAPKPPAAPEPQRRRYDRRRHPSSEIGNALRAFRLREGVTQSALAELLDVNKTKMSLLECGSFMPEDDVLERFAALSGHTLEALRAMRDGGARVPQPEQPPPSVDAEPPPVEAPLPPPPSATQPADGFEDFVDQLCELVPVPADKETRRRWFAIARELHGMAGER